MNIKYARVLAVLLAIAGLTCLPAGAGDQIVEDFDTTWNAASWQFSNGAEFPGAKGSFERSKSAARAGEFGGKLSFDFSAGGNYVAAILKLKNAPDIKGVRLWLKNPSGNRITFRYTDATGQTLQKTTALPPYGEWVEIEFECWQWSGNWGGANDGVVHGPPSELAFCIDKSGSKEGALLIDDVRLIEGKPVAPVWTYVASRFEPGEGWFSHGDAKSQLMGKVWHVDYSKGNWAGIGLPDRSLPGTPKQFHLRFKGDAGGHNARLSLATHFMSFERNIGEARPVAGEDGVFEFVTPAPPGEGWHWSGGENDGKLHGPLRITGFALDCGNKRNAFDLELLDLHIDAECSGRRLVTLTADLRQEVNQSAFCATLRSLSPKPLAGELKWTIRDWAGKTMETNSREVIVPAGGEAVNAVVAMPPGGHKFLEAEFTFVVSGQDVPPVQAYFMAPIKPADNPEGQDAASPFGMGLYLYRYGKWEPSLREMERAAKMGADAGVKWSREEFGWGRIEPAKGRFDWTFYDKVVAAAKRNGITIYGELGYWSDWTKPYTQEGIDDYCRFVATVVEHYRNDIHHWEIWNEPNIFFWQGPRELYAQLLKQAYAAIKKANPEAQVLGCSTAGIDQDFIKQTMKLGAPFDILTIHPYRGHLDDKEFISDLRKTANLVKKPDGNKRPVWITEMGWATHTPHNSMPMDFEVTTQRRQAELIARAYIDSIASGVGANISWYDFRCDGEDPFNFEHNMGIITRDFRPKPAYCAYATMTRLLRGLKLEQELNLGEGVVAFRFSAPGKPSVTALWSISGDKTVSLPASGAATLTGLMGDTTSLSLKDGNVKVPLKNEVPVFICEQ
jgi:GH35 family endo-1,4-beta-xylanase